MEKSEGTIPTKWIQEPHMVMGRFISLEKQKGPYLQIKDSPKT